MSPVPDPSQNHKVDPLNELNYESHGPALIGPGYSSEEEDHLENEVGGYQPLAQGPENLDDEDEIIDYSSLSGLLNALNSHGPNEISGEESSNSSHVLEEISVAQNFEGNDSLSAQASESRCTPASTVIDQTSDQQFAECEKQKNRDYRKEQATLWNSPMINSSQIEIDDHKKEVIKLAMAKITLPCTAIPPWAKELSEEEWKTQVYSRLFGKNEPHNEPR